jgi:outer membrane protein assembly factor BamB
MKRSLILITILLLTLSSVASAQMTGGSPRTRPGNGMPGGRMGGGMGVDMAGVSMHRTIVAADGTVFFLRRKDANNDGTFESEILAIRPTGTIGWTTALDAGMNSIEISGNVLVAANSPYGMDMDWNDTPTANARTRIVGLSVTSGSQQWKLEIDGVVFDLEPFSGGIYATVVKPAQTGGNQGMHGPGQGTAPGYGWRSLIAISSEGRVLWTLPID